MTTTTNFRLYRVLYNFHHSKMGFQNSITCEALSEDHALVDAMEQVKEVYGSRLFKKFTFQIDPSFTPKLPTK